MTGRAALLAALLLAAACKETRQVRLTFGSTSRVPIGFRCKDSQNKFLAVRAFDRNEGKVKIALLVDFLGLSGLPSCRLAEIQAYCESHACMLLSDPPRVCFDIEKAVGSDENAVTAVGELVRTGLTGQVVTEDAPHGAVVIRATATAQRCSDLAAGAAPDPAKLVGCAVSCPVQLDGVDGDILLDLPTLSDDCAAGVLVCASGGGLLSTP